MDFWIPLLNSIALGIIALLFMVGLIESPWQLLLLILVAATLLCQWLIRRDHLQTVLQDLENKEEPLSSPASESPHHANNPAASPQPSDKAVLSYRGASYKAQSTDKNQPIRSLATVGKYRGRLWRSGS